MKKLIATVTTVLIYCTPHSIQASDTEAMVNVYGRTTTSLNGFWNALPDYINSGHYRRVWEEKTPASKTDFYEYSFDGTPKIAVPGDFNSQLDQMKYSEGTVWYKHTFNHDADSRRERTFLYFGAVNYMAEVYLNGELIGQHEGGFTPFQFEVTDRLRPGDNTLIVMADNRRRSDGLPGEAFDWFGYGGITRDVMLVHTPGTFVDDYFIRLDPEGNICGDIHLDGNPSDVTVSIPELRLKKTIQAGSDSIKFTTNKKPQRWSPANPKLYHVEIICEGDTIRDRIGFRDIRTDGDKILLNGEPIFVKAVNIHEETLGNPARAFSREHAIKMLSYAKDLGCNMVRLAHYPHNEHTVRLAEEMGLMVWDEIPVYQSIQFTAPGVEEKIHSMMHEMVRRDKNRCAVTVWSLSNETWPSTPGRTDVLTPLTGACRQLDDTRLITHVINTQHYTDNVMHMNDPLYDACDLLCINEYVGWYIPWQGEPEQMQWDLPSGKPLFISEFGGEAKYGSNFGPKDSAGYWSEEFQADIYRKQIRMFDATQNLAGVCPWILFDYLSLGRMHPVYQGGYNRKGLVDEYGKKKQAYGIMKDYYSRK